MTKEAAYIPTDDDILRMYEAAKAEQINQMLHISYRDIIVSTITVVISLLLFGSHWWLLKKYSQE